MPGVTIGTNVITGAGSVVTHDIPENSIAAGNPARIISRTSDYLEFHEEQLKNSSMFREGRTLETGISDKRKKEMREILENHRGYLI